MIQIHFMQNYAEIPRLRQSSCEYFRSYQAATGYQSATYTESTNHYSKLCSQSFFFFKARNIIKYRSFRSYILILYLIGNLTRANWIHDNKRSPTISLGKRVSILLACYLQRGSIESEGLQPQKREKILRVSNGVSKGYIKFEYYKNRVFD